MKPTHEHPQTGIEKHFKKIRAKGGPAVKCSKRFSGFPFAHRQPTHDGHCALVHGHNWDFEVTFEARELDENGFVYDFGKLQIIKHFLADKFDHTLVIPITDPQLPYFAEMENKGLCKLVTLPGASAESLAEYTLDAINTIIEGLTCGRVTVTRVTVYEDEKNAATAEL